MGYGFKHGPGGGVALNFRVVGGTSQPASPRENDIWVNTDYISGWVFASTEPENPTEGLVWIVTGNTSAVAFNALKKNSVMVYPLDAKQYTVGVWDSVAAKSYQNEAWVDWWSGQLYDNGKEYLDITGELTAHALDFSGTINKAPTITKNDSNIVITTDSTNYSGGLAYWANKIDLTNYSALKFTGYCSDNSQDRAKVLVLSDISESAVAAEGVPATALSEIEIDISTLSGSYYIGFSVSKGSGGNNTVTINQVILEGDSEKPAFVNQVPISTDTDGSIYNGTGYKDNARLSSSGGVSGTAQNGSVVTGFIPYSDLAIVRIKGATWAGLTASDGHYYINAYDSGKAFTNGIAASDGLASTVAAYDAATGVTTFDFSKLATSNAIRAAFEQASYIRLNAKGTGADLIVTVDQEIT